MVVYILYLKADLEGVASLKLLPGAALCLSVRNPTDIEDKREQIVVDSSALEEVEDTTKNSHTNSTDNHHKEHQKRRPKHEYAEAPCHFGMKWSGAITRSTIRVLTDHKDIGEMTVSDEFVPMLALECDGVEPYDFHVLGEEFQVTNKAGEEFRPADLSSGSWQNFDLGTGTTRVSNLQVKFK